MAGTKPLRSSHSDAAGRTYIALLRGINVGGRNKLPMADLVDMFTDAGCENVRTYIQSGNVVFTAPTDVARALPQTIPQRINDRLGLSVPVITRRADELAAILDSNPYLKAADTDTKALHVAFLSHAPDKRRVAQLDPARSPGDSFEVRGSVIYLHLPNGVARTKLTNDYFDATLDVVATLRNWRTVEKLNAMVRQMT